MEADVSQDFQDYWNEYRVVTYEEKSSDDDHTSPLKSDDEGLDEAEWLVLAGLSHLTDSYLRGQEIEETELEPVMSVLSLHQANAVRRRVHSLNQTIKHRPKAKHKKPDIRDVFKNVEDFKAIDAKIASRQQTKIVKNDNAQYQPYSSLPDYINLSCSTNVGDTKTKEEPSTPRREIFRRVLKTDKDVVASGNADGITMLAFQRFGTVRDINPLRSSYQAAASTADERRKTNNRSVSESTNEDDGTEFTDKGDNTRFVGLGFENMWQQPNDWKTEEERDSEQSKEESIVGCTWVDTLSEDDLVKLRPLLFVELSAIFDKAANPFPKIKPFKRKRKQGG